MWTPPFGKSFYERLCKTVGCSHMSGLCAWLLFEDNRFGEILTALAINAAADTEAKTVETTRLENIQSLKELKQKLDEHVWLRDRYIVFPNVSGEGKFSRLRNGMMAKYKEMPFVGGYVDGDTSATSALKVGPLSILAGKDKNWGNKRIASPRSILISPVFFAADLAERGDSSGSALCGAASGRGAATWTGTKPRAASSMLPSGVFIVINWVT
jgi:hypothetical protein